VCAFTHDHRTLLATAGEDATVRIWNPDTGVQQHALRGHTDQANRVCTFPHHDRILLATASGDRTVRIWDPVLATAMLVIPTRDRALAIGYVNGLLVAGTNAGLLAIRLNLGSGGSGIEPATR
jgi:WD40 repeat protein